MHGIDLISTSLGIDPVLNASQHTLHHVGASLRIEQHEWDIAQCPIPGLRHPGVGPSQPTETSSNDGDFRNALHLRRPLFAQKTAG
jgi:hypothetical protein